MRKITIILVLLMFAITAIEAKIYYIDPSGNNTPENGSAALPWKTLSYACSMVSTPGDIIHVNAGTYAESTQSVLAVGVSIEGEGNTSVIHSNVTSANTPTILLQSSVQGTRGDQSISNIRMVSDLDAWSAIMVATRSNVSINHCEFENFFSQGVVFIGQSRYIDGEPSVYAKGNTFHDNIMINCADYIGSGKFGNGNPNLGIGGQQDMTIFNNTITQKDRGLNSNGYPIKFVNEGYLKGVKIYNNTLTKPPYDGQSWDLCVELWHCRGGVEVYGNTIIGSLDFGGNRSITNDAGNYGYALKVYDNILGQPSLQSDEENGLYLERGQTGGAYIYNNIFRNLHNAFQFTQGTNDVFEDIYIYNNVITGVGILGRSHIGNAVDWMKISSSTGIKYSNINFVNNTIHAGTSGMPNSGLRFTFQGPVKGLAVRNNIIVGFGSYAIYVENSNITNMWVENNNFYGNNNNTPYYTGSSINEKIERNNQTLNPSFISSSDFRLQPSSPLIGAGMSNGLTADFEGKEWNNPPSIGAYEAGVKHAAASAMTPECQLSVVENAKPSVIEMNFNMELSAKTPEPSAFKVTVNSIPRAINNISISGNKVLINLATPVANGNTVLLTYDKPAVNPVQSAEGIQSASIPSETVTNRVDSESGPAYFTGVIENSSPSRVDLKFKTALANTVPSDTAFSVIVKGVKRQIKSIAVKGNIVNLSLVSPVAGNEEVTVSYYKPQVNHLRTGSGDTVPSIISQNITNKVITKSVFSQEEIAIYPNPAAKFINISIPLEPTSKPKTVRIYDISGKLHLESGIEQEATKARVPINLATGIYIVQLIQEKTTIFSRKVLVRN